MLTFLQEMSTTQDVAGQIDDESSMWQEDDSEPERTVVVRQHDATDDSQLELKVGEIVIVLEKDETGWWGGHKEGEDFTGWFPGSCVGPLLDSDTNADVPGKHEPVLTVVIETKLASPVRKSQAVSSPQRRSQISSSPPQNSSFVNIGTPAKEETAGVILASLNTRDPDSVLVLENAQLKLEKQELEEVVKSLKQQLRKSDADRAFEVERTLKEKDREAQLKLREKDLECESKLDDERRKSNQRLSLLEQSLRQKEAEVNMLKRLSLTSQMSPEPLSSRTTSEFAPECRKLFSGSQPNSARLLQSPEVSRHALQSPATTIKAPSPECISYGHPVPSTCSQDLLGGERSRATHRTTTTSSRPSSAPRPAEEEPPLGLVAQTVNAFEKRSQTPRRDGPGSESSRRFSREASRFSTMMPVVPLLPRSGQQVSAPARVSVNSTVTPVLGCPSSLTDVEPTPSTTTNFGMSPIKATPKEQRTSTVSRSDTSQLQVDTNSASIAALIRKFER